MSEPDADEHRWATADTDLQPPNTGTGVGAARAAARPADGTALTGEATAPGARRSRRVRAALWACTAAIVLVAGILVALPGSSAAPQGYTVTQGPVGAPVYLTLPVHVGARTELMEDSSPLWTTYPALAPSGPADDYEAVGAMYTGSTAAVRSVVLDVLFAKGHDGHLAVFSVSPQRLLDLVVTSLYLRGARRYPDPAPGALLECGTYALSPICFWADPSTLGFLQYSGTPATVDDLAALVPTYQSALIRS